MFGFWRRVGYGIDLGDNGRVFISQIRRYNNDAI